LLMSFHLGTISARSQFREREWVGYHYCSVIAPNIHGKQNMQMCSFFSFFESRKFTLGAYFSHFSTALYTALLMSSQSRKFTLGVYFSHFFTAWRNPRHPQELFQFVSFRFVLFYLASFCFVLLHFIPYCFIFVSFNSFYSTLFHFIPLFFLFVILFHIVSFWLILFHFVCRIRGIRKRILSPSADPIIEEEPECSLNVHGMFPGCSLNVHRVFTECSLACSLSESVAFARDALTKWEGWTDYRRRGEWIYTLRRWIYIRAPMLSRSGELCNFFNTCRMASPLRGYKAPSICTNVFRVTSRGMVLKMVDPGINYHFYIKPKNERDCCHWPY
jgi:hypothetical protein